MVKRKLAVIALLALTVACIHKTGGTVTPWEKVTTYNAALAQANNTLTQGVVAVQSANLISVNQAAPILNTCNQVATLHKQITAILATGSSTQATLASVTALAAQIKASVASIPPAALGIKNPKSQQSFQSDVNSIGTLVDAVLASLQAVTK